MITAVGEGVERTVGEKVMGVTVFYFGHGSFAEECLVQDATVYAVPVGLTDSEAAGFWIPHITAWTGLVERGSHARGREPRGARCGGRQRDRRGAARQGPRCPCRRSGE